MRGPRRRSVTAALTLACAAACGGAGASYRAGEFRNEAVHYRVGELGADWQEVQVAGGDLAFHRSGMGTISANSTCSDYADVPPSALVNHLLFETTERSFSTEEIVSLDGRGARHVVVQLELDGVPLEAEIYLLKKDGCVFDLTHVRARSAPSEARASFHAFVERFAVLEVRRRD